MSAQLELFEQPEIAASKGVGRSSRTPYKHWILDRVLGTTVGVLSTRKMPFVEPFVVVDTCAGDGVSVDGVHRSSPEILSKHLSWLHSRRFRSRLFLLEQNPATFEVLRKNIIPSRLVHQCELRNMDSRQFCIPSFSPMQPMFINCDPNSIDNMPLAGDLFDTMNKWSILTVTLGCNVQGVKRCSFEKRSVWFDYVESITQRMPDWHDAILVSLTKDSDQWAYLTCAPKKWATQFAADMQKHGDKMWSKGVNVVRYRETRYPAIDKWSMLLTDLFLTKSDRVERGLA